MRSLVDTCVWSCALRKPQLQTSAIVFALKKMIHYGDACMIGPIKQELLSGYPDKRKFQVLRQAMEEYPVLDIVESDYIKAAEYFNTCRSHGILGSHTDFLICAVASRFEIPIFTLDRDFDRFVDHLPIELVSIPRPEGKHA